MRRLIASLLLATGLAVAGASAAPPRADIARAVAEPARPAEERTTDASRRPAETLAFAGVKPGMTVLEFYPGSGYYTRLLSALVGPTGRVHAVDKTGWHPEKATAQKMDAPGLDNVELEVRPLGAFTAPKPVDLAWVTQNYHDLLIRKYGEVDTREFDRRVFAAVKPGGAFLVIDHQANPGATVDDITRLHRIEKSRVIAEVTAAGFRLEREGRFLAQPGDDHTLSIFDKAIQGKTDQYALLFIKPRKA